LRSVCYSRDYHQICQIIVIENTGNCHDLSLFFVRLSQATSVNNSASPGLQDLSFNDKNLLSGPMNDVTGLTDSKTHLPSYFGVAANLGGAIPDQPAPMGGGLGMELDAIYAMVSTPSPMAITSCSRTR
jgi:hypothetical protein